VVFRVNGSLLKLIASRSTRKPVSNSGRTRRRCRSCRKERQMPGKKPKAPRNKQRVISGASARYLRQINAVRVSREDILQFVLDTSAMPKEDRDFEGFTITAIRLHPG